MANEFAKTFATLRTFNFLSVTKLEEMNRASHPFTARTLNSMTGFSNTKTVTPNINALNGVADTYGVSSGFLLDGIPHSKVCYGLIDEGDGGIIAYLIPPVLHAIVQHLADKYPIDGFDVVDWVEFEERGWGMDLLNTMQRSVTLCDNRSAIYPIMYRDVTVGYALTPERASWLTECVFECAQDKLSVLKNKKIHERLTAPWAKTDMLNPPPILIAGVTFGVQDEWHQPEF